MEYLSVLQSHGILKDAKSYILTNKEKRELVNYFKIENKNSKPVKIKANMKRKELGDSEYKNIIKTLRKNDFVFTKPIEIITSKKIRNERQMYLLSNPFLNSLMEHSSNKKIFDSDENFIFTDIDLRFLTDDKHAVGSAFYYNPEKKNYVWEIFNPNGPLENDPRTAIVYPILENIVDYLNKSRKFKRNIQLEDVSNCVNTIGGYCMSWVLHYYKNRPTMEITDIQTWKPEQIKEINSSLHELK